MTKAIRVENADNSDHKVVVQTWEKGAINADTGSIDPDTLVEESFLNFPTAMITQTVWKQRYLVIKEV